MVLFGAIKKPGRKVANPYAGFLNINLVSSMRLARPPIQFPSVQDSPHNCHAVGPKTLVFSLTGLKEASYRKGS
jgi:hypothetical protein